VWVRLDGVLVLVLWCSWNQSSWSRCGGNTALVFCFIHTHQLVPLSHKNIPRHAIIQICVPCIRESQKSKVSKLVRAPKNCRHIFRLGLGLTRPSHKNIPRHTEIIQICNVPCFREKSFKICAAQKLSHGSSIIFFFGVLFVGHVKITLLVLRCPPHIVCKNPLTLFTHIQKAYTQQKWAFRHFRMKKSYGFVSFNGDAPVKKENRHQKNTFPTNARLTPMVSISVLEVGPFFRLSFRQILCCAEQWFLASFRFRHPTFGYWKVSQKRRYKLRFGLRTDTLK